MLLSDINDYLFWPLPAEQTGAGGEREVRSVLAVSLDHDYLTEQHRDNCTLEERETKNTCYNCIKLFLLWNNLMSKVQFLGSKGSFRNGLGERGRGV